jgi:hypothetical protein
LFKPLLFEFIAVTRVVRSIHFVYFFLFINHTIAFAMLWASIIRYSRIAQIAATLYVIGMAVIACTAWDSGNFFNTDTIPNSLKNFITLWPIWGFYRGWTEYKEFATQVLSQLHLTPTQRKLMSI